MQEIEIGDIVLKHQADGTVTPSIIISVIDQDTAILYDFGIGGSGGTSIPAQRGTQLGQWEPRPQKDRE